MAYDIELARVAAGQLGLVTTADVARVGITPQSWSRRVAAGTWIKVLPRVYRAAHLPPEALQRAFAALLMCGPAAVLSHRTAAWILGLDGFGVPASIDVTLIPPHRVRAMAGLTVHRSGRLSRADHHHRGRWHLTTATRTIIDLASCCTQRELENAVDSALRTRLITLDGLSDRRKVLRERGSVLLDAVLDGLPQGGLHTRLERDYLQLSRAAGLPDPVGQVVLRAGSRFLARVDFHYPTIRLVVEVSGHRTHSSRQERADDARRHRGLVAAGHTVIEFTSDEVFSSAQLVLQELRVLGRDARNFRSA